MGIKVLRITGLVIMLVASLLSSALPASASAPSWTAVSIPGTEGYQIGPPGVDVRDLAVAADGATIYAAPGNSIAGRYLFKSNDTGASWVAQSLDIAADLVAVAPDNADVAAVARAIVPVVYYTADGGMTWHSAGEVKEEHGNVASIIHSIAISVASDGTHYLAVAGEEAGGVGNVWYCAIESAKTVWRETSSLPGYMETRSIRALALSLNFTEDDVLVAVGETDDNHVHLQVFSFASQAWNVEAGFADYPVTILEYGNASPLASASIALSPDYIAGERDSHIAFIGLAGDGDGATGGIYRVGDATCESLLTGINVHSIAFDGGTLVAGAYDDNTVYRSANPLARLPAIRPNDAMKGPGGENRAVVVWVGDLIVAGTSGDESAFAVSEDGGRAFQDVSLVDTKLSNLSDLAVSENGETLYLASDDGNDLSLWRRKSSWQRVLSQQDTGSYVVRLAPGDSEVVYLAEKGGDRIYCSTDGGDREWVAGACPLDVQDLAVESASTAYVLNEEGKVVRTPSSGLVWDAVVSTNVSGKLEEDTGHMIVSGGTAVVFVGSADGRVAYSMDGGSSWGRLPALPNSSTGRVQVIPDNNFASNRIIYAASSESGRNIMRWKIGSSASWADIFRGNLSGGIYGLAVEDNVLYALEYNASTKQSWLWQCLVPTGASQSSASWESRGTTKTTDVADPDVVFDARPQALKLSDGGGLWAIKTNDNQRLYHIKDAMAKLVLKEPDDDYISPVNQVTGIAEDITFRWQRTLDATEYELAIAQDEEFTMKVASITVTSNSTQMVVFVGPQATGATQVSLSANTTYYWRVRITEPSFRIASEPRTFHVESLVVTPAVIVERPPPPVISIPPTPAQVVPSPPIELPPTTPPPEVVFVPRETPPVEMPGYMWAVIAAGIAVFLTVAAYVLMTFMDSFLIYWLRRGRYRWSRWRRKRFEGKYEEKPLPVADSLEQIETLLKQVTWTMDGLFHLFDAVSYPQTVWAKKKDDCDGFAVLAAALLKQWQPELKPVLITAMLRPVRKSHTVCAFNVPGAGLWFFDNYLLRRGQYRTYTDVVAEVQGKARLVCWDVVEPDTLQTLEFHVVSNEGRV